MERVSLFRGQTIDYRTIEGDLVHVEGSPYRFIQNEKGGNEPVIVGSEEIKIAGLWHPISKINSETIPPIQEEISNFSLNITKGEWKRVVLHEGGPDSPIHAIGVTAKGEKEEGSRHGYIIYDSHVPFRLEEELDNATLIADAGNTYQLTGKLPRELAKLAGVLQK